jgi:hypothetical protein
LVIQDGRCKDDDSRNGGYERARDITKGQAAAETQEGGMMNDNQKAATFIGWVPCELSEHDPVATYWQSFTRVMDGWRCPECGRFAQDPRDIHPICPLMTDAHNYMRALEAACQRSHLDVLFGFEGTGSHYCQLGDDKATERPLIPGHGNSWGQAAVRVLAHLYDKGKVG